MHLYDYEGGECSFDVERTETSSRSHYTVSFPSPAPAPAEAAIVYGDLFVPSSDRPVPLVVITHGYGDASLAPCLTLARLLVRQGIAAFTWYLPIHSRRLPGGFQGGNVPSTPGQWLDVYRGSVLDLRRSLDWLADLPEIAPGRIAAAGISMGAIVSTIAMAVDRRVDAGIFITGGGNMAELSWAGKMAELFSEHGCTRVECEAVYARYPAYLEEVAANGIEAVKPAKECFLFDPLTFSSYITGRPVLLVNGTRDEMVSRRSAEYLWQACGKPEQVWVDDTHVGTYCQSALLCSEITRFMGSMVGTNPSAKPD